MPPRGERASWTETKRLAPEACNVDGGVAVTVVNRAALAAHPLPDCQTFVAFRAVDAQAGRADLGGEFLVDLGEDYPCVIAFILEEVSQHRPAYVARGLAAPGTDLPGRGDVTDEHRAGVVNDGAGILVKRILAPVGDLGVIVLIRRLRRRRCACASFGSRSW